MRLEAHNKLTDIINKEVTRVVIYDDYDNPIAIVIKWAPGMCYVGKVGDPEFQRMLNLLGINKQVIVTTSLDAKVLAENPPSKIII